MSETIKSIKGLHPYTSAIINLLKVGKVGDTITDESIANSIGMRVSTNSQGYRYLHSAIKYCLDNYGIVWQRQRGQNLILCLNPTEILHSSKADLKHIRLKSKRSASKLLSVKNVPQEIAADYHATAAQIAALNIFSSSKTNKKLIENNKSQAPDKEKLLEMFK